MKYTHTQLVEIKKKTNELEKWRVSKVQDKLLFGIHLWEQK